jgi:SAM-dependent methyltransferase
MASYNHFNSIAEVFNRIWYFSDEYKNFVIDHIIRDLSLSNKDILADIGGGTGSFTSRLSKEKDLLKAYCVEPSPAMCQEASKLENIIAVCSDAHTFLDSDLLFNKILFKEVIHHLPQRTAFWKKLHSHLPDEGKILIITRPKNIAFPFFKAAKEAFARHQPSKELIETELRKGGFKITTNLRSHPFTLAKEDWYTMLRHRFMSDLGVFSDDEIEAGIMEIEQIYIGETVEIIDNLIFITAIKK